VIDTNSGVELSALWGKIFHDADAPARKLAEERKNQFYMIAAVELERWRQVSQSVSDDWVKEMSGKGHDGKVLIESARTLVRQYTK